MTYIFRVYDTHGNLADCIAAGDNPVDALKGRSERLFDPVKETELDICTVGVLKSY